MSFFEKLLHKHTDADILRELANKGVDVKDLITAPSGEIDSKIGSINEKRPLSRDEYEAIINENFKHNKRDE